MAFTSIVMPKLKLVHGVNKQIVDPVFVTGNGTRETRRKQNRFERYVWNFPSRAITQESKMELYSFFQYVDGSLNSFMFQDPDLPEMYNTPLTQKPTEPEWVDHWYFEIPGAPNKPGHPLFNHVDVTSQLTYKTNNIDVFEGNTGIQYHPNGRPMIWVPDSYALSNSAPLLVSGPIYLTVRLNSALNWTLSAFEQSPFGAACSPAPYIVEMGDIQLVEVFEHA